MGSMNLRVATLFLVSYTLSHAQANPAADLLYDDFAKDALSTKPTG